MSALILAAVHSLLLWEIDQHSGMNEAGRALDQARERLAPYGRDDLVTRLLSAVIATARDERLREDARIALALIQHAHRIDERAMRGDADEAARRAGIGDEEPKRT